MYLRLKYVNTFVFTLGSLIYLCCNQYEIDRLQLVYGVFFCFFLPIISYLYKKVLYKYFLPF